jgi:hypothetical protein
MRKDGKVISTIVRNKYTSGKSRPANLQQIEDARIHTFDDCECANALQTAQTSISITNRSIDYGTSIRVPQMLRCLPKSHAPSKTGDYSRVTLRSSARPIVRIDLVVKAAVVLLRAGRATTELTV